MKHVFINIDSKNNYLDTDGYSPEGVLIEYLNEGWEIIEVTPTRDAVQYILRK